MPGRRPKRVRLTLAMAALGLVCAVSFAKSMRTVASASAQKAGTPLVQALNQMRTALPPSGTVGYIDSGNNDPVTLQNYYLTQYSLAPLVVTRSEDADWVIGNFSAPGSSPQKPDDLVAVHDFGNGIVLFSKKSSFLAKRER